MRRLALLLLAVLAACDAPAPELDPPVAGSAAPLLAPAPSPRGVAPTVIPGFQRIQPVGIGPVGPVCGDPRLIGASIPAISGGDPRCGVAEPVSLVSVSGVALSGKAEVNCETARAFADWMARGARPAALKHAGSPLVAVRPVASYVCRSRNRQAGAPLSEHAKGNAIDVAEFVLADGRRFDVRTGWNGGGRGQAFIREAWRSACGPFGTVLGPASDRFHRDHFHFDIARHRNGNYCR